MHNLKIYGWSDGKSFAMNVKRGVLNIVKKNAESLTVQRLTSNWIIEETPREKPLSPKFNLPFDKNGDKKFFDPQEGICSQKNGVIDGSWQEFLAQIFPLHCRLIPESFMLMCSKEKKCTKKNRRTFYDKNGTCLAQILGFWLNRLSFESYDKMGICLAWILGFWLNRLSFLILWQN